MALIFSISILLKKLVRGIYRELVRALNFILFFKFNTYILKLYRFKVRISKFLNFIKRIGYIYRARLYIILAELIKKVVLK
jgi:hypothetical protein